MSRRALRFAALLATYLQAMNLSIPNSALRFIQGGLSMADDQAGWIFTSYLAASGITLPIAQWLAGRFGLKRTYLAALATFACGLWLSTTANTQLGFIATRIVQGAASGIIAPLSMAIALETLPPERRPSFGASWTAIVLLGIVSGPAIGGWLADDFGWPSLFLTSIPLVAFIALVTSLDLLEKKSAQPARFDFFGFISFTAAIIGLQMVLDRGERLEWWDSPEIWLEAATALLGFCWLVVHVLTSPSHFLSKALFRDRNFVLCTLLFFAAGFVLLPTMALTSPMLDELLGYPPMTTGLLTLPRGIGIVGGFVLMSRAPRGIDRRLAVAAGTATVIYANATMLDYSLLMDWPPVAIAGAIQGLGLGVLMPALSHVAFSTLAPQLRPEGAGLFNLARTYGSTLGVAVVQALFFNHTQALHLAFASHLTPYYIAADRIPATNLPQLAALNEAITGQAAFIALIGQFKTLMVVMLVVSPLVLLLRKPSP